MKKEMRKGFTIIELVFVLVIVGLLLVGGLMGFNKIYAPTVASTEYGRVSQVLGAIERARADNGGSYPAVAAGTSLTAVGASKIYNQMGGTANMGDLAGYTYGCTAGASSTVTVKTTTLSSTTIADLVRGKVSASSPSWTPDAAGTSLVTLTLTGACS